MQTQLYIINNQDICYNTLNDPSRLYCALDSSKYSNVCFGDSGGPMMYNSNGIWYLYGIASYVSINKQGTICYNAQPSYFVKVPVLLNFIQGAKKLASTLYDEYQVDYYDGSLVETTSSIKTSTKFSTKTSTKASTTKASTTKASTTKASTTKASTTKASTTKASTKPTTLKTIISTIKSSTTIKTTTIKKLNKWLKN